MKYIEIKDIPTEIMLNAKIEKLKEEVVLAKIVTILDKFDREIAHRMLKELNKEFFLNNDDNK